MSETPHRFQSSPVGDLYRLTDTETGKIVLDHATSWEVDEMAEILNDNPGMLTRLDRKRKTSSFMIGDFVGTALAVCGVVAMIVAFSEAVKLIIGAIQ